MKKHRFFIKKTALSDREYLTDGELVHQLRDVLRIKSGEHIALVLPQGREAEAIVESYDDYGVHLRIESIHERAATTRQVTIYAAILKRDNFEFIVQKCAEIGVTKIVPLVTAHTVKTGLNLPRLRSIAQEAAELCGRTSIPEIVDAQSFAEAINSSSESIRICFDSCGEPWKDISAQLPSIENPLSIFVGPEGGWESSELERARDAGFRMASLGETTLRGETASIIAAYLAVNS